MIGAVQFHISFDELVDVTEAQLGASQLAAHRSRYPHESSLDAAEGSEHIGPWSFRSAATGRDLVRRRESVHHLPCQCQLPVIIGQPRSV